MNLRFIYAILVCIIYWMPGFQNEGLRFYVLTTLLLFFTIYELRRVYLRRTGYFFISPIFLANVITFGLVFGAIANYFLLIDGAYFVKNFGYKVIDEPEWLSYTMFLACMASLAVWIGYDSKLGENFFKRITSIPIYKKLYESEVNESRVIFFTLIAYLAKFYLFGIGLYGRIVSEEYFEAGTGFKIGSQLRVLGDLSFVTFFFISILKFRQHSFKMNVLFYGCLLLELFFGFIYGARSAFIAPFLIILIAYYYVSRRIGLVSLFMVGVSTYLAFTIVLDFKNYVLGKEFLRPTNTIEVVSNFNENQNRFVTTKKGRYDLNSALNATLISVTFVPETAVAIRQRDKIGMDGLTNPNIFITILKFPLDAFVPRFIQGENEFPWGFWFKEEVIEVNKGLKYSVAMSPIGWLYMGGGIWLVLAGFWFYGVLLKFAYPFILQKSLFSVLTYIMLLSTLYNLDSIYSNALIYTCRYVFIYPIIFWIMFDSKFFKTLKGRSGGMVNIR
ncbi:MAG: hypothetical protein ABI480_00840 [Chitinophagaceae bacterium]